MTLNTILHTSSRVLHTITILCITHVFQLQQPSTVVMSLHGVRTQMNTTSIFIAVKPTNITGIYRVHLKNVTFIFSTCTTRWIYSSKRYNCFQNII